MSNAGSNELDVTRDQEAVNRDDDKFENTDEEDAPTTSGMHYTVFTRRERWLITVIMGVAMFFSPMTANIYFPAIPQLSAAMHVSLQDINLTITAYIVLQGISPLFVGNMADKIGRRPVYLLTFVVYVGASLGLAMNRSSYPTLLLLRMLQSAGSSATAAISYGVLADVAPPAKRGSMLGAAMVAANTGPTIGPLLGGVITDRIGWHWLFWFLTILGSCFLVVVGVFFPETSRKIVDNGRCAAPRWNRPILSLFTTFPKNAVQHSERAVTSKPRLKARVPNPLPSLRIIMYRDASLVLWVSAIHYMVYYCLQATMPGLFTAVYGLNERQLGLTYCSSALESPWAAFRMGNS
ncbi:hypothetical protein AYL99_02085 [Fonsecaea erecta]|uniref:Major facilitator superfamily (MFS) profile domain-containing protein n=1 Tax=Fonsecaea erecta TaxID=1367422 RepID=A0A178ZSR6_9EURO|nr:hypothetical protein AYL99_02085 [Fonsecaea erecta]OAP62858.1 hypothetical protein AYL99_02085 [Fonsecaea erecta]